MFSRSLSISPPPSHTHKDTHPEQCVCFLSKPCSPILQICLPDNSDNTGLQNPVLHKSFHYSSTHIELLYVGLSLTVCVCVCFMMTLIGKSISMLWLPVWPYQICTWTCLLSMRTTPRRGNQTSDSEPSLVLNWLSFINMKHCCTGRNRSAPLQRWCTSLKHSSVVIIF